MYYKSAVQASFIKDMAVEIKKGRNINTSSANLNELYDKYKSGDREAYNQLCVSQYKLIYNVAVQFINKLNLSSDKLNMDDLIAEAFSIALKSLEHYDKTKISLQSYLQTYIKYGLYNAIKNMGRVVKIPIAELNKHITHKKMLEEYGKTLNKDKDWLNPTTYTNQIIREDGQTPNYAIANGFEIKDTDELSEDEIIINTPEKVFDIKSVTKFLSVEDENFITEYFHSKEKFVDFIASITPETEEEYKTLFNSGHTIVSVSYNLNGVTHSQNYDYYVLHPSVISKLDINMIDDKRIVSTKTYDIPVPHAATEIKIQQNRGVHIRKKNAITIESRYGIKLPIRAYNQKYNSIIAKLKYFYDREKKNRNLQ